MRMKIGGILNFEAIIAAQKEPTAVTTAKASKLVPARKGDVPYTA
jgi:hypothetical protein